MLLFISGLATGACQSPDDAEQVEDTYDIVQQSLSLSPTITSANGLSLCNTSSGGTASPIATVLTAAGDFANGATFEWKARGCTGCTGSKTSTLTVLNSNVGIFSVLAIDPATGLRTTYSPELTITTRACNTGNVPDLMADKNPSSAPRSFTCNAALAPQGEQLRRLTRNQYVNTMEDLFAFALKAAPAEAAVAFREVSLDSIRADVKTTNQGTDPRGGFRRMDQIVGDGQVNGFYMVAESAGRALTKGTRLGALVGTCATDADATNDAKCVTDFITKFGSRALRRPLSASEVTFYKGFYAPNTAIDRAGFADIISGLLQAPEFVYLFENGTSTQPKPGVYALTRYELAARLSYHFWQTMPDDELWQTAVAGTLSQPAVFKAQVTRLFNSYRTQNTIKEFYYDYLQIDDFMKTRMHRMNSDPAFMRFAGVNLPTFALTHLMAEEVEEMFISFTNNDRSYDDLMTSTQNFSQYSELNAIYGLTGNDRSSLPQRPGFLTRARFVATGSTTTRPVQKGLFIRRAVLCDKIDPPPEQAKAVEQPPSVDLTSREVITTVTGSCGYGCHNFINDLGFATENFDGLGRERTEEKLFSTTGEVFPPKPINTKSTPLIDGTDTSVVNGPADLTRLLLASGKGQACLARNYFRFTFGRWENVNTDGCILESVRKALDGQGSLKGMLQAIALAPEFKQRSIASAQ